jgi:hypothetical protein
LATAISLTGLNSDINYLCFLFFCLKAFII